MGFSHADREGVAMSETRRTADGRILMKNDDGTIVEVKGKGAAPQAEQPAAPAAKADDEAPGPVETFFRKASSAVSSNLVNPLSAKISSAISGQPYDEALRGINETDEAGAKANPNAATAGTVAGTGLQIAAPLPLPKGTSTLGRIGANAGVGAGFGAAQGAGDALTAGGNAMDALSGAGEGALIGGAAGGALGAVVPKVEGVLRGAGARVVKRAADDLGLGAGKAARRGLEAKADEIAEALSERPELRKAAETHAHTGNGKPLLAEASKLAADGTKTVDEIYAAAAKPGYKPTNYAEPASATHAEDFASYSAPTAIEGAVTEPRALVPRLKRVYAEPVGREAARVAPEEGGVPLANVRARLDERIAELRSGNQVENDVAEHLEGLRDKLHARRGADGTVDPKKLRHEQSGYQKMGKYGKTSAADSVVAQANQEASEAVGDALLEHVTGMPYAKAVQFAETNPDSVAAKLLKGNGQITAAMRIEQAVEGRAGSNPGAPNRLTHLLHGVTHSVAGLGAIGATGLGHGALGAAIAGADIARTAAPHVARKLDPMIAKIIRQGVAEKWSPGRLAEAVAKAGAPERAAAAENGQ
jgi:hypothetical protein